MIIAFAFLLLPTLPLSTADPVTQPKITINSPLPSAAYCKITPIKVEVTIQLSNSSGIDKLLYCLDGYVQSGFGNATIIQQSDHLECSASAYLFNLDDGRHCLSVHCDDSIGWSSDATANFTVDNSMSVQDLVAYTTEPKAVDGPELSWLVPNCVGMSVFAGLLLFCFARTRKS